MYTGHSIGAMRYFKYSIRGNFLFKLEEPVIFSGI
jgi:hypothetical protein